MLVQPSRDSFIAAFEAGRPQVLWTTLVADLETPVSAMIKLADGQPYSFLLESVEGGASRGRYSIIGTKPDLVWRARGNRAEINRRVRADRLAFVPEEGDTLASLRRLIAESQIELPAELPPPAAGLFGHMGYDMVRLMERLPELTEDRLGLPDAVFIRPGIIAVFDTIKDSVAVVTPVYPDPGISAADAYDRARERLADATGSFDRGIPSSAGPTPGPVGQPQANMTRAAYHAAVAKAKAYIAAGDIFQLVPSQRFELSFDLPPFALYRALRRLNPSPFLFFLDLDGYALVGSSPEILVRLRDGKVTIRPLAGTRRRGETKAEDEALERDLLADPKELAEHLMLLDLGRNDVGRVAKVGTVKVTEKMVVEHYSHVMHIVSNVEGMIRPEFDALSALIAGFPAGTVSGAPKVRAMEIIEELEPERRGFYAGMVGYFAADGSMDNCIALRTALVKDGKMYVQAGGGVVADSDPEAEYQESLNKARALLRAAEEAVRFASRGRS
ncbi:anthranilate synthase, component I [Arboricoccus pini]|uniref:Anthranilate synthase component 1 n=1 Tax=Arboricoccus pini TaxID=1963835 RepID=A0A212QP20_9PROT|nr:anthranilate synthase component I [Arboricoccus pini]SNB61162.1 anthranilate synthase, component I [Arboricoccus pini]